jgi:protein phosphatase
MKVEVGVATDIGRVRERNEDTYLVEPPLYAIADGMGGARGGAVASGIAIDELETGAKKDKASLADLVRAANRAVFERSMTDRAVAGMGTTLTAARVDEDGVHLAHVGDSRAYLLRGGAFRQLTDDHTLVNRMVKAGEITREEAEVHPHRNVLTRSVGTEPDVVVDEDDVPLIDGDRLLLCSDGLTDMVTRDQIQAILETTTTAQEAADRLIKAANRAGGIDNTTVVVIAIHEDEELEAAGVPGRGGAEQLRPEGPGSAIVAPGRRPSSATVKRWAMRAGIVLVALAAVAFVARFYVDRQWYVGESNGHVAVYQGIPAQFAGLRLSHVDVETDLPAADVTKLPVYQDLPSGITANDRSDALAIVEQMRTDLATSGGGS